MVLKFSLFVTLLVAALPAYGDAAQDRSRACGTIDGVPVHAHGISCRTARYVYKQDISGKVPRGWVCSASLARCYKGDFGSSQFMWWRRATYLIGGSDAVAPITKSPL